LSKDSSRAHARSVSGISAITDWTAARLRSAPRNSPINRPIGICSGEYRRYPVHASISAGPSNPLRSYSRSAFGVSRVRAANSPIESNPSRHLPYLDDQPSPKGKVNTQTWNAWTDHPRASSLNASAYQTHVLSSQDAPPVTGPSVPALRGMRNRGIPLVWSHAWLVSGFDRVARWPFLQVVTTLPSLG
jgi:hypothetical protein